MNSVATRLSAMMFLQFFTWGAWFVTLFLCLTQAGLGDYVATAYQSAPIAAIVAPLFLGLVADRLFPSQVVLGVLMLLGAGLMAAAAWAVQAGDGSLAVALLIAHMLCYMPTLGLGNSIAFANIDDPNHFPAIRVWGTIGWIAAGLLVGALGWSDSVNILWLGAAASAAFGLYSFTLPHTPPPARDKPLDLRSLLMLDALGLMKSAPFAVFILCSTLICIPLAYYYSYTSGLLADAGFEQPASTMTIGQMSEIVFMLLVPFFFRRLGVKWMLLVGMAAWVARYVLFAYGASGQAAWMLLMGVALHGVCYDFFFVTGFMYTDGKASPEVRGQAQSMLVFFTQGVGMFLGYWVAGERFAATMTSQDEYHATLAAASGEAAPTGFFESFGRMLSVSLPEGLDPQFVQQAMGQWREFWLLPAGMAAVVFVIFLAAFYEKPELTRTAADAPSTQPADEGAPE
ncbi:putative nucleoside transporter YegT [Pseudobythopirellula maris]|uniref:Putative nucleoside transporter YegT n=1 Tax=Pseudobythopirellula maris TaxID=2527991 RepID=A0A5C5ZIN8_9BACT|nr:MFS transporter [Pseudobythopirellula maris]TWT87252.1 putative nucleoside transporter YegT [Pseudobythopirellula maris]